MIDTINITEILIKTIDFLIEEVKNIRREKSDLLNRLSILERENLILKERLNA